MEPIENQKVFMLDFFLFVEVGGGWSEAQDYPKICKGTEPTELW